MNWAEHFGANGHDSDHPSYAHNTQLNPFEYLVALQKYSAETVNNPSQWMPWNFEEAIAATGT
ncbi:MAG: hypothetical protein PVI90_11610 [Desulfobacteraceae bacterium]|jgi:hypothetical protein